MRWYSALICTVPIMMAAFGPNLNFLDFASVAENIQPQEVRVGEFHLLNERPETIIIPEQENLSPEDDANQKFILNTPERYAASTLIDGHLAFIDEAP